VPGRATALARLPLAAALVVSVAGAARADNGQPPERARSEQGSATPLQRLAWRVTFGEGYDTNLLADRGADLVARDPRLHLDGWHSSARTALEYEWRGPRVSVGSTGGGLFRYYPDLRELTSMQSQGQATVTAAAAPFTGFARAGVVSSPFYSVTAFSSFIDEGEGWSPPDPQSAIVRRDVTTYSSSAGVTAALGTRVTASATHSYRRSQVDGEQRRESWQAGARIRRQLTRSFGIRAGYGVEEGASSLAGGSPIRIEALDIGVDCRRALSRSRRTTFGLAAGSMRVRAAGERYRLTGEVSLAHRIRRTWSATLRYHRAAALGESIELPLFADAVATVVDGHVARRATLTLNAAYSAGSIGLLATRPSSPFKTGSGSAALRIEPSTWYGFFIEYTYYHFERSAAAAGIAWLPRRFDRHGLRAGLLIDLPLIGARRRS